jgi:RNA polymerase sigma-70 factor (ECF subfamily)
MSKLSLHTLQMQQWITRWQQGDPRGADALITAAQRRLESLARSMLRSFPQVGRRHESEDVLQTALLRLLKNLREKVPASTREFFGFAAFHIRRSLIDLARSCRGERGVSAPVPASDSGSDFFDTLADPAGAEDIQLWESFHEAVERLPSEQREVMGLKFYHGWTFVDIAGLLQVNERTVRRRWGAACAALQDALGDFFPPPPGEPA